LLRVEDVIPVKVRFSVSQEGGLFSFLWNGMAGHLECLDGGRQSCHDAFSCPIVKPDSVESQGLQRRCLQCVGETAVVKMPVLEFV
jgi:hypothetical protein